MADPTNAEINRNLMGAINKMASAGGSADMSKQLTVQSSILVSIKQGIDSLLIAWQGDALQQAEDANERREQDQMLLATLAKLNKTVQKDQKGFNAKLNNKKEELLKENESFLRKMTKFAFGLGIFQGIIIEFTKFFKLEGLQRAVEGFRINGNLFERLFKKGGLLRNAFATLLRWVRTTEKAIGNFIYKFKLPFDGKKMSQLLKNFMRLRGTVGSILSNVQSVGIFIGKIFGKVFMFVTIAYESFKQFKRIFARTDSLGRKIIELTLLIEKEIFMFIPNLVLSLIDLVKNAIGFIIGLFPGGEKIKQWLYDFDITTMVNAGLDDLITLFLDGWESLWFDIESKWDSADGFWSKTGLILSSIFDSIYSGINGLATGLIAGLAGLFGFTDIQNFINEGVWTLGGALGEGLYDIWDSITSVISGAWKEFKNAVVNIGSDLKDGVMSIVDLIKNTFNDTIQGLLGQLAKIPGIGKSAAKKLGWKDPEEEIKLTAEQESNGRLFYQQQAKLNKLANDRALERDKQRVMAITSSPVTNSSSIQLNTVPNTMSNLEAMGRATGMPAMTPQYGF